MSTVDFDCSETGCLYEAYQDEIQQSDAEGLTPDELERLTTNSSLFNRVQFLGNEGQKKSLYQIDKVLRVKTTSDDFRAQMVRYWESQQRSFQWSAWPCVCLSIPGIALAIASAQIAIPFGIVAGVAEAMIAAYGASFYFSKASHAGTQAEQWAISPSQAIAQKRAGSYKQGFAHVYHQRRALKPLLLPTEIQCLFERYFDKTYKKLSGEWNCTEAQKKTWLDQFRKDNPMSEGMLRFAYQGSIPLEYVVLSAQFTTLERALNSIQSEFDLARSDRRAQANRRISEIRSQKEDYLHPLDLDLSANLAALRKEKEQRWRKGESSIRLDEEYAPIEARHKAIHAAITTPIKIYFESKVDEVNRVLRDLLVQITQQEASAFSPYYGYAQRFITAALNAKNPTIVSLLEPFSASLILQIPGMPEIRVEYREQP